MKKPLIVAVAGVLLFLIIFFGFNTATPKKPEIASITPASLFNIKNFIDSVQSNLTPSQSIAIGSLNNQISRGDVHSQQIVAYQRLAKFWKDSVKVFEPYAFYISEASKLDNSEKSLTFAAQIFLDNLRWENDQAKLNWETGEAISLFEKALAINPDNDELKIGLGSSYIFGRGRSGNPAETMKGIQQLLSVVRKDSTNMKAQLMLGMGGYVSGQFDKAIERLQKVVTAEPGNLEAIAFLADSYAAKGNKTEAIKLYNLSKRLAKNPHYSKEVDERIRMLK